MKDITGCRSCGTKIWWFDNPKTGKKTPLETNKITICGQDGNYHTGYINHFTTCPQAKKWRKK